MFDTQKEMCIKKWVLRHNSFPCTPCGPCSQILTALVLRPYMYGHFFSIRYHNMSSTVVHLLEWPTLALCSNPGHQPKGHHVPLDWCGHRGSDPTSGAALVACFWLFFLWL